MYTLRVWKNQELAELTAERYECKPTKVIMQSRIISINNFKYLMVQIKSGEILCIHDISNTLKVEVGMAK